MKAVTGFLLLLSFSQSAKARVTVHLNHCEKKVETEYLRSQSTQSYVESKKIITCNVTGEQCQQQQQNPNQIQIQQGVSTRPVERIEQEKITTLQNGERRYFNNVVYSCGSSAVEQTLSHCDSRSDSEDFVSENGEELIQKRSGVFCHAYLGPEYQRQLQQRQCPQQQQQPHWYKEVSTINKTIVITVGEAARYEGVLYSCRE